MAIATPERTANLVSMTMAEYNDAPGMRKSHLDLLHRSPAHYRQSLLCPTPPTPAMEWGSLFHAFILEPDVFNRNYAVWDDSINRTTKAGKEAWADWQAENEGKISVPKPTLATLKTMRDSIYDHPTAKAALCGGYAEKAIFWDRDGVLCKARPDYLRTDCNLIFDLKTTVDARSESFSRSCWTYRYHVQAPYYSDGYEAVIGEKPQAFIFIAIEKTPPYCVMCYHANEAMVEQGRREYIQDLEVYRTCVENDVWPGYTQEIQSIMLPKWTQEGY
jgi:hypothetical protein